MLKYSFKPYCALSGDELARWQSLCDGVQGFQSPFLRPAWSAAFAELSANVEVAMVHDREEAVGFLPYQRDHLGIGRPVGGALCDLQGLATRPDVSIDLGKLLAEAGLNAYEFHALAAPGLTSVEFGTGVRSYYLDIAHGFEPYRIARRRAGSQAVDKALQRYRKLERELGVRFTLQAPTSRPFRQLLLWKERQHAQLGVVTPLQCARAVRVLEQLAGGTPAVCGIPDDDVGSVRGIVSVLEAGGVAAGICYSLIAGRTAHVLITGYNPELARFSPGLVTLVELTRHLAEAGVRHIHLGAGGERFKTSLATGSVLLYSGVAGSFWPVVSCLRSWRRVRSAVKSSPLGIVVRGIRPIRCWLAQASSYSSPAV